MPLTAHKPGVNLGDGIVQCLGNMTSRIYILLLLLFIAPTAIRSNILVAQPVIINESVKILASDGEALDLFGRSLAISENTLAVGAPLDNDNDINSGSVYIFYRHQGGTDNWGEAAKLIASDGSIGDNFGIYVALDNNTLAVGAFLDDDNGTDSGSAYIFERNAGGNDNWGEVAKLTASDSEAGDQFGWSLAISGDTVAVSANLDDANGIDSGSAYIFERDAGGVDNWGEVAKLIASDNAEGDKFGYEVAINGDTVVVGAQWNDDNGHNSGSAYVFERDADGVDNWGEVTKLLASDNTADDVFGNHVEISGDILVVGANLDDDNGIDSGSAYIFERDAGGDNNWGEVTKLIASDGTTDDWLGGWVEINGDTVAVSATFDDDNGTDSGSAYIYKRNEGGSDNWGEVFKLTASEGAERDWFAFSAEISGDTVVIGTPLDDDNNTDSGSVYVFSLTNDTTNGDPPLDPVDLVLDGSGDTVGENIIHSNGNVYNQVLLTGQSVTLRTDENEITRASFLDINDDIVQVEFSGNAIVTVTLDSDTFEAAAPPVKYNQPSVSYVKGLPTIEVEGADENTFLSIFTVGSINAVNQNLFPEGEIYDAVADVALLEIVNSTGFGGILCANTRFNNSTGDVGLKAPGVPVSVRVIVGDIDASGNAMPQLVIGEGSSLAQYNGALIIAGGDLLQSNEANVVVASSSANAGFSSIISQDNFKSDLTSLQALNLNTSFENSSGEFISIPVFRKILEVNKVALSLDPDDPETLSIMVDGMVTTSGWSNPMLVDYNFRNPTADGMLNFDFIAEVPVGPVLTVITPIAATLNLKIPSIIISGVRVHAENNSLETILEPEGN